MKDFICIVVDKKTRADVKEYSLVARDELHAQLEVKRIYKIHAQYTPRLPSFEEVIFEIAEV